jgi:TPR repeat protein
VATGYYLTAIYLERGVAGLQQDPALALRYYRKAADEGNPQAQAYVGISWRRWTGRQYCTPDASLRRGTGRGEGGGNAGH